MARRCLCAPQLLNGTVITDFDEQIPRFADATFGLDRVMNGGIPTTVMQRVLREWDDDEAKIDEIVRSVNFIKLVVVPR